jgi:hypothetical protein
MVARYYFSGVGARQANALPRYCRERKVSHGIRSWLDYLGCRQPAPETLALSILGRHANLIRAPCGALINV